MKTFNPNLLTPYARNALMHTRTLKLTLCAISIAVLAACGGGSGGSGGPAVEPPVEPPAPANRLVQLDFVLTAGDSLIKCGDTITDLGIANSQGTLKDARFYISNIYLIKEDNTEVRFIPDTADDWNHIDGDKSVSLLDFEDGTSDCANSGSAATNTRLSATVSNVKYKGVRFDVGVPLALNHTNTVAANTPKPLQNQAMAWSWTGGRKFAKIEVTNSTWTSPTFNFHLGSTGCTAEGGAPGNANLGDNFGITSCAKPNRARIPLSNFDPDTQRIALDVKALLAGEDVSKNDGASATVPGTTWVNGAAGCMSGATDGDCITLFDALKIDLTGTGLPVNQGSGQTVFKAIAK